MAYNFQKEHPEVVIFEPTGIIKLRELAITGRTDQTLAARKQILWQLNEYLNGDSLDTIEKNAKKMAEEVSLKLKLSRFSSDFQRLTLYLSVACSLTFVFSAYCGRKYCSVFSDFIVYICSACKRTIVEIFHS